MHRYSVSTFVLVGKLILPPAGPALGTVPARLKKRRKSYMRDLG